MKKMSKKKKKLKKFYNALIKKKVNKTVSKNQGSLQTKIILLNNP